MQPGRNSLQKLLGQKNPLSHRSGVEKPGLLRLSQGIGKPGLFRLLRGVEKPGILRLLWGVEKPGILRLLREVQKEGILPLLRGRPSRNRSSTRSTKGLAFFGVFWFWRHRDIFHNMSCSFTSFHLLSLQFSMSCTYTNKRSYGRLSILYVVVWVSSFLSTPSC